MTNQGRVAGVAVVFFLTFLSSFAVAEGLISVRGGKLWANSVSGTEEIIRLYHGQIYPVGKFPPELDDALDEYYSEWRKRAGVLPPPAEAFWQARRTRQQASTPPPQTRYPDLQITPGGAWGRTANGFVPIPVVNGRILVDERFSPNVGNQLKQFYAAVKQQGGSLPPVAEEFLARPSEPVRPSPQTEFPVATAGQRHDGSGGAPNVAARPEEPVRPPPAGPGLNYFNPLPYPQLYKDCEEKHLNGKCVDGGHYALWGDMDHTLCYGKKISVIGHTGCEARARFNFEKCIAADNESESPRCVSLVRDMEPKIRSAVVRNCKGLIDISCRDGVPLDTMQCQTSIGKEFGDDSIPPLRETNADACVSATRLSFLTCLVSGRPRTSEGKKLECNRVGKGGPPVTLSATTEAQARANATIRPAGNWIRDYVDFAHNTNLTANDYRVFESCLTGLFGRQNVISYPYGNPSFVVMSDWNQRGGHSSLQFVHDQAPFRGDCAYLLQRLTTWDSTFKTHQMGPWGVAHENENVKDSGRFSQYRSIPSLFDLLLQPIIFGSLAEAASESNTYEIESQGATKKFALKDPELAFDWKNWRFLVNEKKLSPLFKQATFSATTGKDAQPREGSMSITEGTTALIHLREVSGEPSLTVHAK